MCQKRWLELFKDYDCTIKYLPRKANMVADALSKKDGRSNFMAKLEVSSLQKMVELRKMKIDMKLDNIGMLMATIKVRPILVK